MLLLWIAKAIWSAEGSVSLQVLEQGTHLQLHLVFPRQPSSPGPTSWLITEPCPEGSEDYRDSQWWHSVCQGLGLVM